MKQAPLECLFEGKLVLVRHLFEGFRDPLLD
jgi:hypothetical protein